MTLTASQKKMWEDSSPYLDPGTCVRSTYRAMWTGTVVRCYRVNGVLGHLADIKVTHDRHNNPMRKPIQKTLNVSWLTVIRETNAKPTDTQDS